MTQANRTPRFMRALHAKRSSGSPVFSTSRPIPGDSDRKARTKNPVDAFPWTGETTGPTPRSHSFSSAALFPVRRFSLRPRVLSVVDLSCSPHRQHDRSDLPCDGELRLFRLALSRFQCVEFLVKEGKHATSTARHPRALRSLGKEGEPVNRPEFEGVLASAGDPEISSQNVQERGFLEWIVER
jgi:hypothetical protein